MRRREFIAGLGSAAAWPLAARAQHPAVPVIGFLSSNSPGQFSGRLQAFREGLNETGYVEGRNVAIEYRWANDQNDRLPALAADLIRRRVTVIFANRPSALAAAALTTTIPIVFNSGADPVRLGLVASLNRPGGNLTGVTNLGEELGPKRLELLHELVPTAGTVAALVNPANPNADRVTRDLMAAARTLGLQIHVLHASTESDFTTVFATLVQLRAEALVVGVDALFNNRSEHLAAMTLRYRVPTISFGRQFAAAGGLMSYGGNQTDSFRTAGVYVGRILRGEKVADLPVQQSTKIEFVINLKTAKAIGLTVPNTLLVSADEVIE
jgi:putative tryptophan/tyrosine transport system substrate-binding protein